MTLQRREKNEAVEREEPLSLFESISRLTELKHFVWWNHNIYGGEREHIAEGWPSACLLAALQRTHRFVNEPKGSVQSFSQLFFLFIHSSWERLGDMKVPFKNLFFIISNEDFFLFFPPFLAQKAVNNETPTSFLAFFSLVFFIVCTTLPALLVRRAD